MEKKEKLHEKMVRQEPASPQAGLGHGGYEELGRKGGEQEGLRATWFAGKDAERQGE